MLYPRLHAWFTTSPETIAAHEFEVLRHIVHFLPLEIGDNDKDFIATSVVHAAQEHEFWKLD